MSVVHRSLGRWLTATEHLDRREQEADVVTQVKLAVDRSGEAVHALVEQWHGVRIW